MNFVDTKDIDDAYVRLAECIVRLMFDHYRNTIKSFSKGYVSESAVLAIEREICTPYYAILTMNSVDLPAVCKSIRESA